MKTEELELKTVLIRLLTGIKRKDFNNCEWYEGLLEDAKEEAEELLK